MKKLLFLISCSLLLTPSVAQQWLWGKHGIGDAWVGKAKADNYGNCYLSGLFPNDTIHFGSYTLMNSTVTHPPRSNYADPFLVKYDSKGNVIWAKQWISRDTSQIFFTPFPASVNTSKTNVFLNANFTDSLFVGPYTLVSNGGSSCTCVAKYDSNGNIKWARMSRNSKGSNKILSDGQNISCDNFGNSFLLGVGSYDTISFGTYQLYYKHCIYFNDFLVKYDSSGNVKWAKQAVPLNGNSACVSYGVTNDLQGNVYTTGGFHDSVQYGAYVLGNNNTSDFELIKWDSLGNILWVRRSYALNNNSLGGGEAVTTDKKGNAYVCGDFTNGLIIGQDTLTGRFSNTAYFFVAKYSPNGNLIWLKKVNALDSNSWYPWSISCDNNTNIYVAGSGGYGNCKLEFGGDTLSLNDTSTYDGPTYVFKLDSNGNAICSTMIPGGGYDLLPSYITSDTSGKHVYLGTTLVTPVVFGKDTVNPYSYPVNAIQGINYFPTLARWEACDTSIFASVPEVAIGKSDVLVYPNPSNGKFTIKLSEPSRQKSVVEVYNMLGEKVYSGGLVSTTSQIDLSNEPSGIYLYRVINENGNPLGEGKIIIE